MDKSADGWVSCDCTSDGLASNIRLAASTTEVIEDQNPIGVLSGGRFLRNGMASSTRSVLYWSYGIPGNLQIGPKPLSSQSYRGYATGGCTSNYLFATPRGGVP
jgi:hypothetical protein